ncbi:MAG: type II secretion system protein [bacterium]|nr:type II secretion system protein [bacterium]
MKFLKLKSTSGFTIIETLVALSIFSFSLVGLLTISSGRVHDISNVRNQLTANYLAQEGIETIRNYRDNLVMTTGGWNTFSTAIINACKTSGCSTDSLSRKFTTCSVANCGILSQDATTGYYDGFGSIGTPTPFRRVITIKSSTNNLNDELVITSTVYWTEGSNNRTVEMAENLFNWSL